jgi:hypothetical protein
MLDLTKIPPAVLNDIRERGHDDKAIAAMTPREAFREFCNWNGLIEWGSILFAAVEELKKADATYRVMHMGSSHVVAARGTGEREGQICLRRDGGGITFWVNSDECYPV